MATTGSPNVGTHSRISCPLQRDLNQIENYTYVKKCIDSEKMFP